MDHGDANSADTADTTNDDANDSDGDADANASADDACGSSQQNHTNDSDSDSDNDHGPSASTGGERRYPSRVRNPPPALWAKVAQTSCHQE